MSNPRPNQRGLTRGRWGVKGEQAAFSKRKELERRRLRRMVYERLTPMVNAQIEHAIGIKHTFLRDKQNGRWVRLTDPDEIERVLNAGDSDKTYSTYTKDPSIQAFTDLMNRALDKPAEHVELTGADQGPVEIVSRLTAARLRLSKSQQE